MGCEGRGFKSRIRRIYPKNTGFSRFFGGRSILLSCQPVSNQLMAFYLTAIVPITIYYKIKTCYANWKHTGTNGEYFSYH